MITTALLGNLGILPPIRMDTTLKNHVFTSYPLGAYLNAAGNPVFLFFRILKKKLSFMSPRKSPTAAADRVTVAFAAGVERGTAKTAALGGGEAASKAIKFTAEEQPTRVSFTARVKNAAAAAHKTLSRTMLIKYGDKNTAFAVETIKNAGVVGNGQKNVLFDNLVIKLLVHPAENARILSVDEKTHSPLVMKSSNTTSCGNSDTNEHLVV